jgi:hypothetical protein
LHGLEVQSPELSEGSSVSDSQSDKISLGEKSSNFEGKKAFHGSQPSKGSTRPSNTMTDISGKENEGTSRSSSLGGSAEGGVALTSETTGEEGNRGDYQNNHSFFTAYDNGGYAILPQAERHSDEGKSVSEFTEGSRGGWGKVKVRRFGCLVPPIICLQRVER